MKAKRLLFVSQYFYPEVFRGNDVVFDLANRGIDVTVVTGIPNYPKGKFFKGYGFLKRRKEVINGVKVIRIPQIPRGSNSIQLLLNYISFALNASVFIFFHAIFNKKYDYCVLQQLSPITVAIPAIIYKKIRNIPLYTWVLDLWPESLQSAGGVNNRYVLSFFRRIAVSMYENSNKIFISSKGFKESILDKGDFEGKLIYFPNWAENEITGDTAVLIPELPSGFKVMFAGNIGEAQDFTNIVEAAKLLKDNDSIRFIILGDGRKKLWLDQQIKEFGLDKVLFNLGRFPLNYMSSFFKEADVMLVSLKDEFIFSLTAPAKVQAYMASSKPIIAMMNGEGAVLVKEAKCGMSVPAGSFVELVESIKKLKSLKVEELRQMGQNGKEYCDKYFTKEVCLNNLYNIIFENHE